MSLDDYSQGHQIKRNACQNQAKTPTIQAILEKARRLWQGDTFHFRISGVGKVYVTGFTDDRSRYRIKSKAYLHRGAKEAINALHHALKKGRVPIQIYFDNGKQFVADDFKSWPNSISSQSMVGHTTRKGEAR